MPSITYDFGGCLFGAAPADQAACRGRLEPMLAQLDTVRHRLAAPEQRAAGWLALPDADPLLAAIARYVESLNGRFPSVVVLGIGGSSLGPRALIEALAVPFNPGRLWSGRQGRAVWFLDNVDPEGILGLMSRLDPANALFAVISKSGGTVETAAQLLALRDALQQVAGPGWKDRIAVVTDPVSGPLRRLATEHSLAAFPVPPDVGGRFSVLTAVGLLPAALAGIDVSKVLRGAAAARDALLSAPASRNPAALSAAIHVDAHRHGRPVRVVMPYRGCLTALADWYLQLWGESLGKRSDACSTAVRAVGVTDQHSQLQLYMEGPQDKVIDLWSVEHSRSEMGIPAAADLQEFAHLHGRTFTALLEAELAGTRTALARAGRPTMEVRLDRIDEERIGAMFLALELETVLAAALYRVDPYGQPGVEAGKKLANGILGKAGCEPYRQEFEQVRASWPDLRATIELG